MTPPSELSLNWRFERLSDERAVLGESPVWDAGGNCIWWVDIDGSKVFRTDAESGRTTVWPAPEFTGCVAVAAEGDVMVGMESGIFRLDPGSGRFDRLVALELRGIRFNDSTIDRDGNLWAATMDVDNIRPIGTLYRIAPDLTMTEILTGFITPNGLAVDADRGRLYISDSHQTVQSVWSHPLDIATGAVGDRKVFFPMRDQDGRPDGATLDAAGNYWIAGVGGWALYKLDPAGDVLAQVKTPMPTPTKPAFGGPDNSRMFLTSKTADEGTDGGFLTSAETDEDGIAVPLFGPLPKGSRAYAAGEGK